MSLQEINSKLQELDTVLTNKGYFGPKFSLISSLFCSGYVLKEIDTSKIRVLQSSEHQGIEFNNSNTIQDIPKFYLSEFKLEYIDEVFNDNKAEIIKMPQYVEDEEQFNSMVIGEKFMVLVHIGYINPIPTELNELDIQFIINNTEQVL